MSRLEPGKSTVYASNLPYDLNTTDVENIFAKYGDIVKVTILTVKETRKSKGVAFVLFRNVDDARNCVQMTRECPLRVRGQIVRVSIARDNGKRPKLVKNPIYGNQHQETDNYAKPYHPTYT